MSRGLELIIMENWFPNLAIPILIAGGTCIALAFIFSGLTMQREKDEEIKKLKEEIEELQSEIRSIHEWEE